MNTVYYRIKDLNMVGKEEDYVPYLYKSGKGWIVDHDNILMDRIMGFDESESSGSPYKIGNDSMMDLVEQISEKEAEKIISGM